MGHTSATVIAAEAQAAEPLPAWPPPYHREGGGTSAEMQHKTSQGGAPCLCPLLGTGAPGRGEGKGGAHAHCRERARFAGRRGRACVGATILSVCRISQQVGASTVIQ